MYFNDDLHYEGKKFRPSLVVGWVEEYKNIVGVGAILPNKLGHGAYVNLSYNF